MFITFKRHRYLLISIFSFISIIFYELSIDITNLFPKLMANVKSFAVMENNGKVVFLDSKTKFIINNDPREENLVYNFKYIDYDKKLLNGQIDLKSINNITLIQGNRAVELGKLGLKTGAIGGFSLMALAGTLEGYPEKGLLTGLICGAIDGVALGGLGLGVGSALSNIEHYNISKNEWQFVDIGDEIQNN